MHVRVWGACALGCACARGGGLPDEVGLPAALRLAQVDDGGGQPVPALLVKPWSNRGLTVTKPWSDRGQPVPALPGTPTPKSGQRASECSHGSRAGDDGEPVPALMV